MTEKEVIKQLKCDMELITFNPINGETIPVECLNDLSRAAYEADKIAISALEKQIPKKPTIGRAILKGKDFGGLYRCGICGRMLKMQRDINNIPNYCSECGQKIDWSEI